MSTATDPFPQDLNCNNKALNCHDKHQKHPTPNKKGKPTMSHMWKCKIMFQHHVDDRNRRCSDHLFLEEKIAFGWTRLKIDISMPLFLRPSGLGLGAAVVTTAAAGVVQYLMSQSSTCLIIIQYTYIGDKYVSATPRIDLSSTIVQQGVGAARDWLLKLSA